MSARPVAHQRWNDAAYLVRATVRETSDAFAGRELCRKRGLAQILVELAQHNEELRLSVEAGDRPPAAVLNRPELLHFANIADADLQVVQSLLSSVASAEVRRHWPLSGIWADYADALVAFTKRSGPAVLTGKPAVGSAKRYVHYIEFMQAQSSAARQAAIAAAREAFNAANRDRRAIDWLGLDGDGNNPVKWDFRLSALHET